MISSKSYKKPETIWLLIILAVASILRFYRYGSFSYSNDELSALHRLYYDTFSELVEKGFFVDGHPGGIQVFMWKWVAWFGDNEWSVRLPFVLMGIGSVWLSYRVARYMFGEVAGLFTAAALTFMQFPLLYSQIARPYGPGVLFGLMLVNFWLLIFFDKNGNLNKAKPKVIHLTGFALSAALCMYTHYFSFLFALIVGFSGFIVSRRQNIFQYIGAALVAALLFIPHIPITLNHLSYKGVGLWLGPPSKTWLLEHLYFIFDESRYILILFLITLSALVFLYKDCSNSLRYRIFLAGWFLIPVLIGYFYSIKVNPVLQHPVLIFSMPYFVMLIFSFGGNDLRKSKQYILAVFLAAGVTGTVFVNSYYSQQHFGEFKDVARLTAQWQHQYGEKSITKAISINNPLYIDFYLKRYQSKARFDLYSIDGNDGLKALSEIVRNSQTPYFLYAIAKPTPAEAEDIIRSYYPYIVDMRSYREFSSIVLFGKEKGKTYAEALGLVEIKSFKASLGADTLIQLPGSDTIKAQKLDSLAEYSPGIEFNYDEFRGEKGLSISAETDLYCVESSGKAALVISIETPDGKNILWKGAAAGYVEKVGTWSHIINTFKIETDIPVGAKIKIYFWNADKKVLYLKALQCVVYRSS